MEKDSGRWIKGIAQGCVLLFMALVAFTSLHAQQQGTVTYVYTDPQGTPLAETDAQGNITATYDYTPYGTTALGTPPNGPGYTGHVNDPETNLVYMQGRYYDPATGRFLSVDPLSPAPGNAFNFNRFSYGNNNPITYIDPTGKSVTCGPNSCTIDAHSLLEVVIDYTYVGGVYLQHAIQNTMAQAPSIPATQKNNSAPPAPTPAPGTAPTTDGNTNPYAGPVDSPVVVVDKNGNAIPVDTGQSIGASKDGDYQQVKDVDGRPTGDRLDRGGHSTQSDPQAQQPHAHRPGVTDPNGNPHLPINPPAPPPPPTPPGAIGG